MTNMTWWTWLILGILLFALEISFPGGFFLAFFGLGAIAVGTLSALGIISDPTIEWVLFSVISIILVLALRARLISSLPHKTGVGDTDSLVGARIKASEKIAAGATSQITHRGSTWSAKNVGDFGIDSGDECEVVKVDGITLMVRKI